MSSETLNVALKSGRKVSVPEQPPVAKVSAGI